MSVGIFLRISPCLSFYIKDFSTLCGVHVEGDSDWSIKSRHALATDLQILQLKVNKRELLLLK